MSFVVTDGLVVAAGAAVVVDPGAGADPRGTRPSGSTRPLRVLM